MQTCTQCGATSPADSKWCTSCYLLFAPPAAAASGGTIEPALPPVGPDVVIPPQPPSAQPAAVLPPSVPAAAVAQPPLAPVVLVPTQPTATDSPPWPHATPTPQTSWAPPAQWGTPVPESAFAAPPGTPVHPGWAPPAGWSPPDAVGIPPSDPVAEGRLLSGRALALVGLSIGLGGVYQLVARWLARDPHVSTTAWLRWNLVLVLVVYAIVGTLVVSQLTPKVRLRWGEGSRLVRVAYGASFGLLGGGAAVAAQSAVQHRLATDPRGTQIMGEGDIGHILIAVLLLCVAAPLVEETLFRGVLLESLRRYGRQSAIFGSALCFAIWHFNKAAIIYYTLMGCVFALIYLKRGLLSSMSAHAAFNGALTVAAIAIVLGPGHTYSVDGIQFTAPGGWTQEQTSSGDSLDLFEVPQPITLDGPDNTGAVMFPLGRLSVPFDPANVAERVKQLDVPLPEGSSIDGGSVREATLPTVGTAVEVNIIVHATGGELVFFSYAGEGYMLMAITGDSPKAASDIVKMLNSLQPAGSAGSAT